MSSGDEGGLRDDSHDDSVHYRNANVFERLVPGGAASDKLSEEDTEMVCVEGVEETIDMLQEVVDKTTQKEKPRQWKSEHYSRSTGKVATCRAVLSGDDEPSAERPTYKRNASRLIDEEKNARSKTEFLSAPQNGFAGAGISNMQAKVRQMVRSKTSTTERNVQLPLRACSDDDPVADAENEHKNTRFNFERKRNGDNAAASCSSGDYQGKPEQKPSITAAWNMNIDNEPSESVRRKVTTSGSSPAWSRTPTESHIMRGTFDCDWNEEEDDGGLQRVDTFALGSSPSCPAEPMDVDSGSRHERGSMKFGGKAAARILSPKEKQSKPWMQPSESGQPSCSPGDSAASTSSAGPCAAAPRSAALILANRIKCKDKTEILMTPMEDVSGNSSDPEAVIVPEVAAPAAPAPQPVVAPPAPKALVPTRPPDSETKGRPMRPGRTYT